MAIRIPVGAPMAASVRVTAVGHAAQPQDVAESDAEQRWHQLDDGIDHVAPFGGRGSVWEVGRRVAIRCLVAIRLVQRSLVTTA